MKQVLNFYSQENDNNDVILSEEKYGEIFRGLSSVTECLFKDWVVKSIKEFVYIRNVNTPKYEEGLGENNKFKRMVEIYLSNLGKNNGENITYNFLPSEYMDIEYTIPINEDNAIIIEIKGFKGDNGELEINDKGFYLYVSQKNTNKRSFVSYHNRSIDIRRKPISTEEIIMFKKIYEYVYILALSEFIYRREESYIEHMIKNLDKIKETQRERKALIEKYGLTVRGVEDEN